MRLRLLIIFVAFVVASAPVYAQVSGQGGSRGQDTPEEQKNYLYQWTDSTGVVHITDNLAKVPKEYRSQAQKLESPPGTEGTEIKPEDQELSPDSNYSKQEQQLRDQKEIWKARMKTAKQRLADAQKHYQELKQKRDLLLQSWGGPASGHLEGPEEAARVDQEMAEVQQEIDEMRRQIEVVLPDEARKAGVPPGWLRE